MASNSDKIRELVKQYPDSPARTLAREACKRWPKTFANIEHARSAVRVVLGVIGKKNRKRMAGTNGSFYRAPRPAGFQIPAGVRQIAAPLQFNDPGKWLIISDVHVPYQDETALLAALDYGVKEGCKHVCINGDFYDFYKISQWERDPEMRNPQEELDTGRPILEQIAKAFPGRHVYKIGNHEDRYERHLQSVSPELAACRAFRLVKFLELEDIGFEMVASKQEYAIGKLPIYHGHELPKGLTNPVNIARGVYLRTQDPGLVGHWHKTSDHTETSARKGRMTVTHSTGCLCDLKPGYAPVNSWNHGFAILDLAKGGEYQLDNKRILNGKVY
jgi:predicted phosphodiesterase